MWHEVKSKLAGPVIRLLIFLLAGAGVSVALIVVALRLFRQSEPRLLSVAIVLVVFVVYAGFQVAKTKLKAGGPQTDNGAHRDPEREERVSTIRRQVNKWLEWLRNSEKARKHSGSPSHSLVPWYSVIGSKDSGKTTLISSSGFTFSHSDCLQWGSKRPIEPTNQSLGWLADNALIIDTPGFWTSENQGESIWKLLLEEVRRIRSPQLLNGLVVVVDLQNICSSSDEDLLAQAGSLWHRLADLKGWFSVDLPTYVIFSKLDFLDGFQDTFAHLDHDARSKLIWGCTLRKEEYDQVQLDQTIEEELDTIYHTLRSARRALLTTEHGIRLYPFPLQFRLLQRKLRLFLSKAFEQTAHNKPILHGFYFSSCGETGQTFDLTGELTEQLKFPWPATTGVRGQPHPLTQMPYFVDGIFSRIIFPESGRPRLTWKSALRRLCRVPLVAGFLCSLVALFCLWRGVAAFRINQTFLENVNKVREINPKGGKSTEALAALASLRHGLEGFGIVGDSLPIPRHSFWRAGWGMYVGDDVVKLGDDVYVGKLKELFVGGCESYLKVQLNKPITAGVGGPASLTANDKYYLLETYLMISEASHATKDYLTSDRSKFKACWLEGVPGAGRPEARSTNEAAAGVAPGDHFDFYLNRLILRPTDPKLLLSEDGDLVRRVRAEIGAQAPVDYYYKQVLAAVNLPSIDLGTALGGRDVELFSSALNEGGRTVRNVRVPGAFTRDGWQGYVKNLIEAKGTEYQRERSWVLGTAQGLRGEDVKAEIERQLRDKYFSDYETQWTDFLRSIRLSSSGWSRQAAPQKLLSLAGNPQGGSPDQSAMYRLLKTISLQTFEDSEGAVNLNQEQARVVSKFHAIHSLIAAGAGQTPRISDYLQAVYQLYLQTTVFLQTAPNSDPSTVNGAIGQARTAAASVRAILDETWRPTVGNLFQQPVEEVAGVFRPDPPAVLDMSAHPRVIQAGESSSINWNVQNSTQVTIQPGVGRVSAQGSAPVSPTHTTTYRLTATGPGGTFSATATVTVRAGREVLPLAPHSILIPPTQSEQPAATLIQVTLAVIQGGELLQGATLYLAEGLGLHTLRGLVEKNGDYRFDSVKPASAYRICVALEKKRPICTMPDPLALGTTHTFDLGAIWWGLRGHKKVVLRVKKRAGDHSPDAAVH